MFFFLKKKKSSATIITLHSLRLRKTATGQITSPQPRTSVYPSSPKILEKNKENKKEKKLPCSSSGEGRRTRREMRGTRRPLGVVMTWVRRQPPKVKAFLAVVTGMAALVFIRFIVHDHDNLFVAAEAAHALGIGVLIYKLTKEKTCAGSFSLFPSTSVPDLSRSGLGCSRI
jgi:hypothetical protein